jgi:hypothetical protein
MYIKIISSLLITALLTQIVGCYSYQEVTKDEFIKAEEHVDLQVKTKYQYFYEFDEGDYIVKEDSLYGSGKFINRKNRNPETIDFTGSIYLADIESFKFDRFDVLSFIIGIAVFAGIIALMASNITVLGSN